MRTTLAGKLLEEVDIGALGLETPKIVHVDLATEMRYLRIRCEVLSSTVAQFLSSDASISDPFDTAVSRMRRNASRASAVAEECSRQDAATSPILRLA